MKNVITINEHDQFTSGKYEGENFYTIVKENPGYIYFLWCYGHGDDILKGYIRQVKRELIDSGRSPFQAQLMETLATKKSEIKQLKDGIKYLESFIEFCKQCKNPNDDCIC